MPQKGVGETRQFFEEESGRIQDLEPNPLRSNPKPTYFHLCDLEQATWASGSSVEQIKSGAFERPILW